MNIEKLIELVEQQPKPFIKAMEWFFHELSKLPLEDQAYFAIKLVKVLFG